MFTRVKSSNWLNFDRRKLKFDTDILETQSRREQRFLSLYIYTNEVYDTPKQATFTTLTTLGMHV